jgi:hypothetical protein
MPSHPLQAVLDPYDDGGALFTSFSESERGALEKTAEDLSERLPYLGDSQFALVLEYQGKGGQYERFRKFACTDAGNVARNICYFLQYHRRLPEQAVKVAAQNLWRAAEDFDLPIPEVLRELSGGDSGEGHNIVPVVDQSFEKKASFDPPRGIAALTEWWTRNRNLLKPLEKRAFARTAVQEAGDQPVLPEIRKYAAEGYAPDLLAMILLRKVSVSPQGESDAAYDKVAEIVQAYDTLYEKRASLAPMQFALQLLDLDREAGFSDKRSIPDAVYSTFGVSKQASEAVIYNRQGIILLEDDLKRLALRGYRNVKAQFGDDVAEGLRKDPVSIFRSMPAPEKLILARMASEFTDDRPLTG